MTDQDIIRACAEVFGDAIPPGVRSIQDVAAAFVVALDARSVRMPEGELDALDALDLSEAVSFALDAAPAIWPPSGVELAVAA